MTSQSTGLITIDLAQIAANWQALALLVTPAECASVVKADAYGLGAARVVPALWNAGCRTFFIATPAEAHQARALAPGATIFALDGLVPGTANAVLAAGALPVLSSLPEVAEWADLACRIGAKLACAIQVDSGLNRLGLSAEDIARIVRDSQAMARIDIRLVMSHLASADDPANPKNEAQRLRFDETRRMLPPARASLAASDGLMLGRAYHFDLVRPGYALYGGQASEGSAAPVRPVVKVAARVLQVRDVAPGETVGYSGTWAARRPSRVAIVAAGYADGFARGASAASGKAGGQVRVNGVLAPVAGRVSMDLITVDVTDVSPAVRRGDFAEIIGPSLTIETVGTQAGTIGYEVLTRLGTRFERVYTEGELRSVPYAHRPNDGERP